MHLEANARNASIEDLLGYDGRWESMWIRYCRGVVAPSESRLNRIEKILHGTAQYYRSPLWRLYSPRKWNRLELELAIRKLNPIFRQVLRPQNGEYEDLLYCKDQGAAEIDEESKDTVDEYVFGEEDKEKEEYVIKMRVYFGLALIRALQKLSDPKLGMSALNTIFLMLQDLYLNKDFDHSLILCQAWVDAEKYCRKHPLLKHLPIDLFHQGVMPLAELLPNHILSFIRNSKNIPCGNELRPSDIFWFLKNGPNWEVSARTRELLR